MCTFDFFLLERKANDAASLLHSTMANSTTAQPIIEEPVQFQYNADFPSLPAENPTAFPPADPSPCARITTRAYDGRKQKVATVQNVLVRTLLPTRIFSTNMDEDSSSSSDDESTQNDDDDMMVDDPNSPSQTGPERAYWMQRTVREAIYGRVLYALVLKRRPRDPQVDPTLQAEWEVTDERCAVKEMSWQHIRKERDRLAEDPIKEVSAMQYLQKWYTQTSPSGVRNDDFFRPILETNVMMPLDLLSDDRHLYSIMPYCDGGELFDRLDLNEKFSEDEARYWMFQVLNVRIVVPDFVVSIRFHY